MVTEEFKAYQRALNKQHINYLAEGPLPQKKPLLEPEIKINVDISDLSLDNLPINIKEPVQEPVKDKPVKSNSVLLF